ncbi:MAG: DUF4876 domain-containing protein [Paramuribaculum sp.]|nr:DUF4876 domain-containing protein [Paramuribaculum sp.]
MKMSIRVKSLIIAVLTLTVLTACDDALTSGENNRTAVAVAVDMPQLPEGAEVVDRLLTFRNVSSGKSYEFTVNADIELLPGLYDVAFSARVFTPGAATTTLRADSRSVNVSGSTLSIRLTAYNSIETDDLIIAEVFFSGTLQPSGNQYYGDDYVKLYNNTDHTIYADGITLFETKFLTTRKYTYEPDIMSEAMTVQALYTIPGSGEDVPVAPGEYLLLVDTGIDHRVANPNSFDLSGADFEWYDVSSVPKDLDIDGPVPNLDKWYCYTRSFWVLHNRGFKAFGIARIPVDRDTYLKNYLYTYEYEEVTVAGTFSMSQTAYRMPNEWILDVVTCSIDSDYAWQLCTPALDCGWTGCGTIDKDKTRYFHSVRRKLLYVTEDGRAVLADTNNSSEDFNRMCVPSEIELQHTAMDINGTPATTVTYDGVVPMP